MNVLAAIKAKGKDAQHRIDDGVRILRESMILRANPRSGLIEVVITAHDASLAAFISNALVEELDRFNQESRSSRGRAVREFVQARLEEARRALSDAERALAEFKSVNVRIGNSPNLVLQSERYEREVRIQTEIYTLLSRQFELARIEEHRDTPTFSILEQARPPLKKWRPQILLNAASASALAVGLVLLLTLRPGVLSFLRGDAGR